MVSNLAPTWSSDEDAAAAAPATTSGRYFLFHSPAIITKPDQQSVTSQQIATAREFTPKRTSATVKIKIKRSWCVIMHLIGILSACAAAFNLTLGISFAAVLERMHVCSLHILPASKILAHFLCCYVNDHKQCLIWARTIISTMASLTILIAIISLQRAALENPVVYICGLRALCVFWLWCINSAQKAPAVLMKSFVVIYKLENVERGKITHSL